MADWREFEKARPEMAALGRALLRKHGGGYLATTRRDGAPRVHPVCPFIVDGRLFVATPPSSPKRFDLLRDGRYALHLPPGERDDEFYVTGRATLLTDDDTRKMVIAAAPEAAPQPTGGGLHVRPDELIFEYDIGLVMTAYWEHVGQPGTYAVRQVWRAPKPRPST
jgi:hypothetical protein